MYYFFSSFFGFIPGFFVFNTIGAGLNNYIEKSENKVIEDVWFIHSGVTDVAKKKLNVAMATLGLESYFWPLRGTEGGVLIGPFDSQQRASEIAEDVMQLTGESVWVSLMPGEVL